MSNLLKASEVAKRLAISPRKLWELTNRGEIPCLRIDKSVRYDSGDLELWIESKKKQRGSKHGR